MYTWSQVPRAQTTGAVYEIVDTLEYTSPVPSGGTPEAAVADYKAWTQDQSTTRTCTLWPCTDGSITGAQVLFEMPSGRIVGPDEN
ncbi:MAG TPA: hypothetical protein VJN18_11255 [Polyangiaceae bacterium]|nr:hypothetical protein [Polyangiaceae bacterium]